MLRTCNSFRAALSLAPMGHRLKRRRKNGGRSGTRKRRRTGRRTATGVPRGVRMAGFPSQARATLRYVDNLDFTPSGSAMTKYSYAANDLFDPQIATGGHQPMGFDQWSVWYNHYVVTSAKITVKLMPTSSTAQIMSAFGVFLSDDTATSSSSQVLKEQGLTKWKYFSHEQASRGVYTVSKTFNAKKFFGVKDMRDNLARLGASVAASPAEIAVFIIWAQVVDEATTTGAAHAEIVITYNVEFAEPKLVAQS